MSESLNVDDERSGRQLMSDLADGRGDAAMAAFDAWAREPGARQVWHAYHLIGDALRSDDLVTSESHDLAFLDAFRKRLADEPVVLAPARAREPAETRLRAQRWALPAAAVAGVVVVAGVLVATRVSAPPLAGPTIASAPVMPQPAALAAVSVDGTAKAVTPLEAAAAAGEPQWQVVDGKLIRDAHLDRYLRAHRGSSAALSGGVIGRIETVVLER